MLFPTVCVDNFYDDPDKVRELALSLEYTRSSGRYPGKRTQLLHEIEPIFFQKFCSKLFSLYYDYNFCTVSWQVASSFQIIPSYGPKEDLKNMGWVHQDDGNIMAGIIYLTPDINLDSGTSIFKLVGDTYVNNPPEKINFLQDDKDEDAYISSLQDNRKNFIETARFQNVYNRMISFDAEQYHGVNSFYTEGEPRLTQTFFVTSVESNSKPPMGRMAEFNI
jgi:hypothetical protein